MLLPAPARNYLGGVQAAGSMPAGDQRWLQVRAWLPADASVIPGRSATVRIGATGFGDTVITGPAGSLPNTGAGAGVRLPLLAGLIAVLAVLAVLAGLALSLLGRRRRSDGEPS